MLTKLEYEQAFARNLRRIMNEKGISQAQMSRDLEINKTTISTWMNGEHMPRMGSVDMLCKYLGCTRADLIEVEQERQTRTVTDDQADLIQLTMKASPDNVALALALLRKLEGLQ